MDKIILTGLKFFAYHGVTETEREQGQDFLIDVTAETDFAAAAIDDDLSLSVDYDSIYQKVADLVTGEKVNLIETLASRIADSLLIMGNVTSVTVTVKKPTPPIKGHLKWVGVQITRTK